MVFPLVTFPYASRILEADGIGIVNFYNSIISYISLVTCLGIPLYATREIAKVKHDPRLVSSKSAEILILHLGLTLIGYIIVAILCVTVPKIKDNWALYLILSTSLIFTTMGCEWYFRGMEDFKYITIRGLICRIIYIPLLFILVKSKEDLLIYGGLTVLVTVGNNTFNFYRISRIIKLREIKDALKVPTLHLKGATKIFLLSASISLYLQVNIILLGFLTTATNVGYYVAASRISVIFSGIIVALQTSLLPRSSALLSQNNQEAFKTTMTKVLDFIACFTLPMVSGLLVMAPLVIKIIAGDSYDPSIPVLRILSINLILSIFNNFLCAGILIPQGKEKLATYACLLGGVSNIVLNFVFIPLFSQNGAAWASILTELVVGIGMIGFAYKFIPIKLWHAHYIKYIFSSILVLIICYVFWHIDSHEAYRLTVIPTIGVLTYIVLLNLLKDSFFKEIQTMVLSKLHINSLVNK